MSKGHKRIRVAVPPLTAYKVNVIAVDEAHTYDRVRVQTINGYAALLPIV